MAPVCDRVLYSSGMRSRLADACAVRYTRYPEGLASALHKIGLRSGLTRKVSQAAAPMYIENPIYGGGFGRGTRLGTHAVQDLISQTGVFTAEYGDAMSQIVNIITATGGEHYKGTFEYNTSNLGPLSSEQDRLRDYKEFAGSSKAPQIAIVDWKEVRTQNEFQILKKIFEKEGCPTIVADPRELHLVNGRLEAQGVAIDLIYRRVIFKELIERIEEVKDFLEAKRFVDDISTAAEKQGHHPSICIDYNRVVITLTTHAIGGLSENDFIMANIIDELNS